jgi:hypothetical protein
MSQVIAFWNISPFDKNFYQGQLLGTVAVDGDEMAASSVTDYPLEKIIEEEESAENFLKRYSRYSHESGLGSRVLGEGEEAKDIVYDKYVVKRFVPGKGIVTEKSYTIDEKGVWHKDAKES